MLRALGLGAAMIPLLEAESARAAGAAKRLVTITWTNGVFTPNFTPPNANLTAGPLSPILTPLQPYAAKMLIPQNVHLQVMIDANNSFGGHFAMPCLFTGVNPVNFTGQGTSIDQTVSDALLQQGVKTPLLNLGAKNDTSSSTWKAAGQRNTPNSNPYDVFTKLFAGAALPPATINNLLQQDKSVLDLVGTQLTAFANRLGAPDKVKIQAHLDAIRSLEMDLSSKPTVSTSCAPPTLTQGVNFKNDITKYPVLVDMMMRLAGTAIICGVANVVTIDLTNDGGGNDITFPTLGIASPDFHSIAHSADAQSRNLTNASVISKTTIDTWFYKQVATLLGILDQFPEGAGTALDNSLVVTANDMSIGHSVRSIPYILFGSAGGFFKTGRVVDTKGVPNNKLLTTMVHAMGLTSTKGVGVPQYTGDIDSLLIA
jgi:hypothetical protein